MQLQCPQGRRRLASLGFGSVATLFEVVIVARNGRGHCGSKSKYVFFEEGFDFVVEDTMENLQNGHALVSDMENPAIAIAHKDTARC